MLPDNLGYIFDTALALTPSKPAVFQGDTVLTYAELDARANRMANALAALGVGAGDRVALLFNNDFRFLETLFGTMRLGAVAVPLNIRMGDEALRYVAEDSEAAVLVANAALAERGLMLAAQIPAIKHVIADGPAAERRAGLRDRAGRRRAHAGPPRHRLRRDVHAALHVGLHRQAQGRAADPRRAALERRHPAQGAAGRRHRARADRGAALPQERDGGRGEAVPARGRLARDPARLRRARGHPRHRPLQGDVPHRRARDVQDDPRREGGARPPRRLQRALRGVRLGRGARGAARGVPPRLRRADRRELRAHRGRAGADRQLALGAQEAQLVRARVPGLRRQAGGRGRARGGRRRGGRAGHPQPGAGQGLLEAAGGDGARSSAAAGSTPATSCAGTPTATTTSSGAATT